MIWRVTAVTLAVLITSIIIYPQLPLRYSSRANLLLRPTNQEGATTWDQSIRDALDDNAIQTKIDVLHSSPLQQTVITQHDLLNDPEFNKALHPSWIRQKIAGLPWLAPWLPEKQSDLVRVEAALVKRLVVKRERKSYLMQIGYDSQDAKKAADLTNSLVNAFLKDQIGRKIQSHQEILSALYERIVSLENRYHADEQAEHDFAVTSGIIHISTKDSMLLQLRSLSTSTAEAHRKRVETASRAEMLARQGDNLDNTSDVLTSPMLQRLRERLVELSTGAGVSSAPSGGTNIIMGSLRHGIESEQQHLIKAAQNDAAVALQSEMALRVEIARIDSKMVQWEEDQRHRDDLHRAVQRDLDALNGANMRYMQEAGRGDILQTDVEIVASAGVPDRPSFPDPLLYAAGTLLIICFLDGLLLYPMLRARKQIRKQLNAA